MSERLIIHNFASITKLELEIKQINIIIGPQASGKSICAKLLFYFKSFARDLVQTIQLEGTIADVIQNYENKFEEFFPSSCWVDRGFRVRYEVQDCFIEVHASQDFDSGLKVQYSEHYNLLANDLTKISKEHVDIISDLDVGDERNLIRSKMFTHVSNELQSESLFLQLFIPAARAFFYTIQSNIFSLISNNILFDPFLKRFGAIYETVRKSYSLDRRHLNQISQDEVDHHINEILCGKYLIEKGKDFLTSADGRKIPVSFASSGQQEALPLLVVLLSILKRNINSDPGISIYIEEPEAHLFPTAQKKIIEIISMVFNSCEDGLQFFITTHSPYVLTAFNNLIQAGLLYEELPEESKQELESIVPQYKALNPGKIQVYALEGGYGRSIMSEETGLIDATIIDEVSNELSIEFGQLLDLIN
jgi:AAA15 family ATPase/GTPase